MIVTQNGLLRRCGVEQEGRSYGGAMSRMRHLAYPIGPDGLAEAV
jgi:hypothetical protein